MTYSIEELIEFSSDELIQRKHKLIQALPNDDHARNFNGWNELDMIDEILSDRNLANVN